MNIQANIPSELSQTYNLALINKMCRGDQASILKMVNVFIKQISASVETIMEAHRKKDLEKMKNEIHKAKPTMHYYGTAQIEEELLLLEKLLTGIYSSNEIENKLNALESITLKTLAKMKSDFSISN